MTIENERLVEYLGLELELCYQSPDGKLFWVLVDRIRRRDEIAREMLRLFNRFTRIGKSFSRISNDVHNVAPYSRCVAVRMRARDMTCGVHVRTGVSPASVTAAPRYESEILLNPTLDLGLSDPILQVLTLDVQSVTGATRAHGLGAPSGTGHSGKMIPGGETERIRGRRAKAVKGKSEAAAAITREVQSGNSRQQVSQSMPDHSPITPATPSTSATPSDASSSSVTSSKPK